MSVLPNKGLYPKKPLIILCYRNPIAILQHQLEYWFSKYSHGFYKFIEPCKHPLYKAGDSWTEEIGYSRPVFNRAFDSIGMRYNSKTEFMNAKDKFHGMLYASYYDRKTNKTFFVRNPNFIQKKESFDNANKEATSRSAAKNILNSQNPKILNQEKRGGAFLNNRSRNETNNHSYGGTIGGKNENSFTVITSSSPVTKSEVQKTNVYSESKKIAEDMKNIWMEEVGLLEGSYLSQTLIPWINKAYQEIFNNSLDLWRQYCRQIASSKFLMGEKEKTNFKAKLSWAIKRETYERIQAGDFTLGDREVAKSIKQVKQEADKALQEAKEELQRLSRNPDWIKACLCIVERIGGYAIQFLRELDLVYPERNNVKGYFAELKASNMFYKDYVQRKYEKEIHKALEEINGTKINYLHFTV